jgi:hypothetical protein
MSKLNVRKNIIHIFFYSRVRKGGRKRAREKERDWKKLSTKFLVRQIIKLWDQLILYEVHYAVVISYL